MKWNLNNSKKKYQITKLEWALNLKWCHVLEFRQNSSIKTLSFIMIKIYTIKRHSNCKLTTYIIKIQYQYLTEHIMFPFHIKLYYCTYLTWWWRIPLLYKLIWLVYLSASAYIRNSITTTTTATEKPDSKQKQYINTECNVVLSNNSS